MCRAPRQVTTTTVLHGSSATARGYRWRVPELAIVTEQLLAPVPGGTGRYTAELARALAETAPAGWTVVGVTARHRDSSAAVIDGVAGPRMLPLSRRALIAAWQRGLPPWPAGDAVHAPTPLAPARRARPLVVTVHDTVPWTHPETLTARGVAWHRGAIARAARVADAIVVPTKAVADELRALLPGARVAVVPNGVSGAVLRRPVDADAIARRLALPSRYALAVGTVEPRKGLEVAIDALADDALAVERLSVGDEAADDGGLSLVVAGPQGWGGVDVMALARRKGLPDNRIRVLGAVTDDELAVALGRAAMLVAPSRAEGFGLPVLEAMAAGVAVVHSDIPALVEVAGGTGVAVPVGDARALAAAMRAVLDDRRATEERVTAARAMARRFTWRAAAEAVWALHLDHR